MLSSKVCFPFGCIVQQLRRGPQPCFRVEGHRGEAGSEICTAPPPSTHTHSGLRSPMSHRHTLVKQLAFIFTSFFQQEIRQDASYLVISLWLLSAPLPAQLPGVNLSFVLTQRILPTEINSNFCLLDFTVCKVEQVKCKTEGTCPRSHNEEDEGRRGVLL